MSDYKVVRVLDETVSYTVREWVDQGVFDWVADTGAESDELFESVEDAEYDIRSRH